MKPRERVFTALQHEEPDRVPLFEIWIDALFDELGQDDPQSAYPGLGQDCIMMPSRRPAAGYAGRDGPDEWGRIWRSGVYAGGAVSDEADLKRFSPSLDLADEFFDAGRIKELMNAYPDHCFIYGTHVGPLTAGYMAMGPERFFVRLVDDPAYVCMLLEARTEWCIALFRRAVELGAEVLVLGDDAASSEGPMISPEMWREFVLHLHTRIVDEFDVPVVWHSDGNIEKLLPMAVEAGFAGIHGLEPAAGMNLARTKSEFGDDLVLIGNIDVNVLCGFDLGAVRKEVARCMREGAPGGGYMMATCNSIFDGMNPAAVAEMFRLEREIAG